MRYLEGSIVQALRELAVMGEGEGGVPHGFPLSEGRCDVLEQEPNTFYGQILLR